MAVPELRPHLREHADRAGRVRLVTRRQNQTSPTTPSPEAAASAAAFLAGQEITRTDCRACGAQVHGINGRYACGVCGWTSPWHEGHRALPTAEDDPDWPGHAQTG